ncbi:MAG TPA: UDP-glucose 4-epimerase GalE [Candidatus Marinimicrobia bacterium]|nr:UDP-glucose 4-epimerase GalE [Candidatus Neomarinimicrobiota bacterium]HIB70566.1 UDP-glucose 4-epimerase GalE [Candidatus Neomarinimicrobiota bacterium]HIB94993.1 UDP-glucose 4-epimerase GalE [Candidatus Neomarinimicrobiota bacterium]HIO88219.1 UDP-glucose 4-epimerase GalE [Candidatus Neomarinimicrobiota bacterium]
MKVLVTGGAGYIGSHIVLDLLNADHEVVILDDMSRGAEKNIHADAQFIRGSTLDASKVRKALAGGVEAVVHLAAFKAAGESMTDPEKYSTNNISGTLTLLNTMVADKVKTIVFSSTAAVYGYPEYLPMDEDHPTEPINYYGYTKLAIEQYLKWYGQLKGVKFAALRYFNAAGYDDHGRVLGLEKNPANLVPIIMEVASGQKQVFELFGNDYDTPDGTGIRDYIHVTDLASAHLLALDYLLSHDHLTVNLSSGESHSVLDVVKMAEKVTRRNIAYNVVNRRSGDPAELVATSKLAKETLGWEPIHSGLEELLSSMWKVYQHNFEKKPGVLT